MALWSLQWLSGTFSQGNADNLQQRSCQAPSLRSHQSSEPSVRKNCLLITSSSDQPQGQAIYKCLILLLRRNLSVGLLKSTRRKSGGKRPHVYNVRCYPREWFSMPETFHRKDINSDDLKPLKHTLCSPFLQYPALPHLTPTSPLLRTWAERRLSSVSEDSLALVLQMACSQRGFPPEWKHLRSLEPGFLTWGMSTKAQTLLPGHLPCWLWRCEHEAKHSFKDLWQAQNSSFAR